MYRHMGLTLKVICNKTQLAYNTVRDIIKKADNDPEMLQRARARALEEAAMQVNEVAMGVLQHITPDSLTHDRIVIKDENGKVIEVKHSGPTGQSNAITFGVLTDKAHKMQERAEELRGGGHVKLSPDTLSALLDGLSTRIGNIETLNVNIDLGGLKDRVSTLQSNIVEADYTEVDETDDVVNMEVD